MEKLWIKKKLQTVNRAPYRPADTIRKEMENNIFSNFFFGSKAAEEMFSTATAAESVETVVAESVNSQIEAGEGDLDKFFDKVAEEQAVADEEAAAAKEAERARLIKQYAASFKDRILKEVTNKDWDRLVRAYEKSSEEEDFLVREVAILYNEKIAKVLPPAWWEKRAPELSGIRDGELGAYEILLAVIRSEVSQKANVRRQAAASNLLKQVKAAAEELGLSETEFPHRPLSAADTEAAAIEIGRKCLTLAVARAIRENLLEIRHRKVRLTKEAEQAFYLITSSRQQKWGTIIMATRSLITSWQKLEDELCSRPGAPIKILKEVYFRISLEERAKQVAGHCHLDLEQEIAQILAPAAQQQNKD